MWRSFAGYYDVEITCACASELLTKLNENDIQLYRIRSSDELHVRVEILKKDLGLVIDLVELSGGKVQIIENKGVFWLCVNMARRPALLVGVVVVLFLSLFLSTRILFINVVGNESIPEKYILERAEACGVRFGSSRHAVRSEKVKNRLLESLPQLRWAGVNTSGCVATIIVKERDVVKQNGLGNAVGKVVAKRDGIIREMVVRKGSPLCNVGQAVKAGQVLVSGYTDTGLSVKAEMPDAEIIASTIHNLNAVSPVNYLERTAECRKSTYYQLRFGKKLINFCKDSGILGISCVKMYSEKDLVLPGGFALPVTLIKVDVSDFEVSENQIDNLASFQWLSDYADKYVIDQMISGEIVEKHNKLQFANGCAVSSDQYLCSELIGQVQCEELITGNGKRN